MAASGAAVAALGLALSPSSPASATDDPLVEPDQSNYSITVPARPGAAIQECHGHVDPPSKDGGTPTYPNGLWAFGYVQCAPKPMDIKITIWLQWYNGTSRKWVTAKPGDSQNGVTTYLTASLLRDCRGGTFYHWRTVADTMVNGVQAPQLRSTETLANCGHG